MAVEEKIEGLRERRELQACLRRLARWKGNDVVKLAFLEPGDLGEVDGMDLSGVAELKRHANGAFEVKFVDKVKVLDMLRELAEEQGDSLKDLLQELKQPEDGDED